MDICIHGIEQDWLDLVEWYRDVSHMILSLSSPKKK
jgi:hypothetical protein